MVESFRDWTKVPGNRKAHEKLDSMLRSGSAIAFVGAGASAPNYPLWNGFIRDLINRAIGEGELDEEKRAVYERTALKEPTHIAEELREILGRGMMRQIIAEVFSPDKGCTQTHLRLLRMPFKSYVTTNYDYGLSLARERIDGKSHPPPFTWRSSERQDWFRNEARAADLGRPILHLHGLASDPESLILSESQYQGSYSAPGFELFFQSLLSTSSLVFVGFGFSDSWVRALSRQLFARTRQVQTGEPQHIAILGLDSTDPEEIRLERRRQQREFNSRVLFYPVHRTEDGGTDHSNLQDLLESLAAASEANSVSLPPDLRPTPNKPPAIPTPDDRLPFLRIEFQRLGEFYYAMEIEIRIDETREVLRMRREFTVQELTVESLSQSIFHAGPSRLHFEELASLRKLGQPLRVQFTLAAVERSLDQVPWEKLEWDGEILGSSPYLIFSRRLLFVGGDHGLLKINSSADLDFSIIDIPHEPPQEEAGRTWLLPCKLDEDTRKVFSGICQWNGEDSIDLGDIRRELERSAVVYLRVPLGIRPHGDLNDLKIPLPEAPTSKLFARDLESLLSLLRTLLREELADSGPAILILPTMLSQGKEQCPPELSQLAGDLARTGIAAVISPSGSSWQAGQWEKTVRRIVESLSDHGVIDLAVAAARRKLPQENQIRLHLRAKSGRLFYRPGLVLIRNSQPQESPSWEALRELFSDPEKSECVVLVGSGFDPELSLSRRRIAKKLARQYGFSLSRRDMEDLARVAEYIRVSQPPERRADASDRSDNRPHISAFLQCTKHYLLKHPLATNSSLSLSDRDSVENIVDALGDQRLKEPGSPYLELADLRVKQYVTSSFHTILEKALADKGRQPIGVSFSKRPDPHAHEEAARLSLQRPLIYHCFGNFREPDSLLLSETDFLEFFAAFCREDDPLTQIVSGNLVNASLIVLGFNPNNWDFKLLFSAIRSMGGRHLSARKIHVAVQVDPEDDHTIDPDGARNFYRGLLSELGREGVLLYWGRSTQFLADLRDNVPEAFQSAYVAT